MEVATYQREALRAAGASGGAALRFAAGTRWGRQITEPPGACGVLGQEKGHESTGDVETGGNSGRGNVEDALLGKGNLRGRDAYIGAERRAVDRRMQQSVSLSNPFEHAPLFRPVPPSPSWPGKSTTPTAEASGAGPGTLLAVAPRAERNTTDCGQQQASPFDALEDALLQNIILFAAAQAPLTPFRCQAVCRRWRAALGGPPGTPKGTPTGTLEGLTKSTPESTPEGALASSWKGTLPWEDQFWERCFRAVYQSSPALTVRGHLDLTLLPTDQYGGNWYTARYTRAERTCAGIRAGMALLGGGGWLVRDTSGTPWRLKYQNHVLVCQALGL